MAQATTFVTDARNKAARLRSALADCYASYDTYVSLGSNAMPGFAAAFVGQDISQAEFELAMGTLNTLKGALANGATLASGHGTNLAKLDLR